MAHGTFSEITAKVAIAATMIFVLFLVAAYGLYWKFGPPATFNSAYLLKVADALINGAIVGVFLAVLRTIFELPKFKALLK